MIAIRCKIFNIVNGKLKFLGGNEKLYKNFAENIQDFTDKPLK